MAAKLQLWATQGLVPAYTRWNKANPAADPVQTRPFRVDFSYLSDTTAVLLEFDEQMHDAYDARCELVRMGIETIGYGARKVHWIRYNPDAFKVAGVTRRTSTAEREALLLATMQAAFASTDQENRITVEYVCYNSAGAAKEGPPHSDLVQTFAFPTIEDYCLWVDRIQPDLSLPVGPVPPPP